MRYTKYFAFIVKENGQPNIDPYQFRRMMNIVHLEGLIEGLNKVKIANRDTNNFYKYDMIIFKEAKRLAEVTGNQTPELLIKEMINSSS